MFNKLVVAYDHNASVKVIERLKVAVNECGAEVVVVEDNAKDNDYPLLALRALEEYKKNKADGMILLCGTGIGMNMVANKFDGFRSVLASNIEQAYYARRHEDANCIVFATGYNDGVHEVKFCARSMVRMIKMFLSTPFEGAERHKRRVNEIAEIVEKGGAKK